MLVKDIVTCATGRNDLKMEINHEVCSILFVVIPHGHPLKRCHAVIKSGVHETSKESVCAK